MDKEAVNKKLKPWKVVEQFEKYNPEIFKSTLDSTTIDWSEEPLKGTPDVTISKVLDYKKAKEIFDSVKQELVEWFEENELEDYDGIFIIKNPKGEHRIISFTESSGVSDFIDEVDESKAHGDLDWIKQHLNGSTGLRI